MVWDNFPYLLPYFVSLIITCTVGLTAYFRRSTRGAFPFALIAFSQASWTFGYIFELNSVSLSGKIFWDDFQIIGAVGWPLALMSFVLQYTGRTLAYPRLFWGWMTGILIGYFLLALTDASHRLIRPDATLVDGEIFSALEYSFTTATWIAYLHLVFLFMGAYYFLIDNFFHSQHAFRKQIIVVLIGSLIPFIGANLTIFGVQLTFQRDTSPITFAVGNMIVAWGLFRLRLFDIIPIARDLVIERIQDAIIVLDSYDRIVDLNPIVEQNFGCQARHVIGQSAKEVFAQWKPLLGKIQGTSEVSADFEYDIQDSVRIGLITVTPIHDSYNELVGRVIVIHDITDRKRIEAELSERNQQLEIANEQLRLLSGIKDEFVSNVSHELRTPISSLAMNLTLLEMDPNNSDQYLDTINREISRLAQTIDDLLNLSRFDQDRTSIKMLPVDLNQMTSEYVQDRQPLASQQHLTLIHKQTRQLPLVKADVGLLGQVLSILLTNAFAYTPSGGEIIVSTEHRFIGEEQWCGFSTKDNGPGILPSEQKHLFSRFFRGKAGRDSEAAGTGLGLAIAKEIVDRHAGRLEVHSEGVEGQGTRFTVLLPTASSSNSIDILNS